MTNTTDQTQPTTFEAGTRVEFPGTNSRGETVYATGTIMPTWAADRRSFLRVAAPGGSVLEVAKADMRPVTEAVSA